jgi:hypothetical protein
VEQGGNHSLVHAEITCEPTPSRFNPASALHLAHISAGISHNFQLKLLSAKQLTIPVISSSGGALISTYANSMIFHSLAAHLQGLIDAQTARLVISGRERAFPESGFSHKP